MLVFKRSLGEASGFAHKKWWPNGTAYLSLAISSCLGFLSVLPAAANGSILSLQTLSCLLRKLADLVGNVTHPTKTKSNSKVQFHDLFYPAHISNARSI